MNTKVKLKETGITRTRYLLRDRQAFSIAKIVRGRLINVLKGNING
jgi:hypothetical protein